MNSKQAEKDQKNPTEIVIDDTILNPIFDIGLPIHIGNQKQIHNPSHEQKTQGKKPDAPRDGTAIVKTMSPHKAK